MSLEHREERRRHQRRPHRAEVGLMMAAGTFEGETVNVSRDGLLLKGRPNIMVVVKLNGHEYQGRLVRVTPMDGETCTYAVQLQEPIPGF